MGLITKHGILIVEFSNQLRAAGKPIMEAVLEASVLRLRPILMTTGAMVLGAVPLAMATGPGAEARNDIGWVIVGGMTVGTLFTLVRRSDRVHVPRTTHAASGRTATRRTCVPGEPALATHG